MSMFSFIFSVQISTANILGDFLIESLSRTSETPRGNFVNRNLSNKLPITWFKTKFIDDINWSSEEGQDKKSLPLSRKPVDEDVVFEEDEVEDVSENDMNVEPNVYSENVNDESNFLVETDANANDIRLTNKEPNYNDCNNNIWLGQLHRTQGTNNTKAAFLWILNDFCDQQDDIEFR